MIRNYSDKKKTFTEEEIKKFNLGNLSKEQLEELYEDFQKFKEHAKSLIKIKEYEIPFDHDPETNWKRSISYYRQIWRLLYLQLRNDMSTFRMTLKIIKNQFLKNAKLTDQDQIELVFGDAEQYLHRLRARILMNNAPKKFERFDEDIPDEMRNNIEQAEKQQALKNVEQGTEYWNQYYQQEGSVDEWYCNYATFKKYLSPLNKSEDTKVLVVGCGLSSLGSLMYAEKSRNIYQIDTSEVLIKHMAKQYQSIQGLNFEVMDVCDLKFPPETFDLVVDKGTIDAIIAGDDGEEKVQSAEDSIWQVLKPGGVCFMISITPIDGIRSVFSGYDWNIEKVGAIDLTTRKITDGATEAEMDENYESSVEETLANPAASFYKITKPIESKHVEN